MTGFKIKPLSNRRVLHLKQYSDERVCKQKVTKREILARRKERKQKEGTKQREKM